MEAREADAVRAFVMETLTLVTDNDQAWYELLTGATRDVVLDRVASLEDYRTELTESDARWTLAREVGSRLADEVSGVIDDQLPAGSLTDLLRALLDFSDSQQWALVGEHYLPEPDDLDAGDFDGGVDR